MSGLGSIDLHLINEGRHERLWEALGAHPDDAGTRFAVWAPNAMEVQVVGDFNGWDGSRNPLRALASSGVWQTHVPGVGRGAAYKFRIRGADGEWRDKADPLAFRTGLPPETISVVHLSEHEWRDQEWMTGRADRQRLDQQPMSVYEVHLPSWRRDGERSLDWDELALQLTDYATEMGFTHVEFMPVMEHPYGGSWGYQVSSYFSPTARLGDPDGLKRLIEALHLAGIGVILDWVPAHFPKDEFALARFDGTPLYEDPNPVRGEHPEWGTLVFNFGRQEVRNFLVANALFWLHEYHADGLRVDAVASMLYLDYARADGQWEPNALGGHENLEAVQFLQEMNATVYRDVPGAITIAEESTSWPGVTAPTDADGLGFGFKWNMGWMHDSLAYLRHEPVHRVHHHGELVFSLVYAHSENYVLPISHDEVVHGKGSLLRKMPGDRWQQLATMRALFAYMWSHPGKQLLFMGQEFAQDAEWAEQRQLDWWLLDHPEHEGVRRLVADLNHAYRSHPALWALDSQPDGFTWLDAHDAGGNTVSYLRRGSDGEELVCVVNFAAVPHEGHRVALPAAGEWAELINTDAEAYGGSGVGNLGMVRAEETPHLGQPASAVLRVPPLGALWLVPRKAS